MRASYTASPTSKGALPALACTWARISHRPGWADRMLLGILSPADFTFGDLIGMDGRTDGRTEMMMMMMMITIIRALVAELHHCITTFRLSGDG